MSYKDKAKQINFGIISGDKQIESIADIKDSDSQFKPKTAPGAMMQIAKDLRSERLKETEELKIQSASVTLLQNKLDDAMQNLAQWDGAKATKRIDPNLISPSEWANRHSLSFQTTDFKELVDEIASSGGNVQPIKVRPILKDGTQHYEIIYGHRRHKACLELGIPVLAVICTERISDTELFASMDRENRERADLSNFEQGMMYKKAIEEGLYVSKRNLAEMLGVSHTWVNSTLSVANLPVQIIECFKSPLEITYRHAKLINKVLGRLNAMVRLF